MSHEIAKLLLEHAGTFLERKEAIATALSLGMPLNEIEDYLDWLDSVPRTTTNKNGKERKDKDKGANSPPPSP